MAYEFQMLIGLTVMLIYALLFVAGLRLLVIFIWDFPEFMKKLPDRIADKMIEKLREEEWRRQSFAKHQEEKRKHEHDNSGKTE